MGRQIIIADFGRIQNNSMYVEFAGNAIPSFYSLNYERIFFYKKGYYIAGRIGGGYVRFMREDFATPPVVLLNQYYQISKCFLLEAGIGWGYKWSYYNDYYDDPYDLVSNFNDGYCITGTLGFRVQTKKGFLLRMGFTPHYNFYSSLHINTLQASAGLSLGYSFK